MYSNKYPGPGPVPPFLDNNLRINTPQGRAGAEAGRPTWTFNNPHQSQDTPPPPGFSPRRGRQSDQLCLAPPSQCLPSAT